MGDIAVVRSRALAGMHATPVIVEVHLGNGLPCFNLVGLPEAEVREARERVRAALQNARFDFPARRVTVNLAPADLPKESGRFDLPIALGVLAATGQLPAAALAHHEFAGELALTGELRAVRGALAMVLSARADGRAFVLPAASAGEAALVRDVVVHPAPSLLAVCGHLTGDAPLPALAHAVPAPVSHHAADLADVRGQPQAQRALAIAAAGGHSLLMIGPPGAGKSMLAERLPGLLPPLDETAALEAAAIASLAGRFTAEDWRVRPFRAPHHTASSVAIVGGGNPPRPGEVSLAHHGVLFLDELPEWDRRVLEVLREPLEAGEINISRAARQSTFPARFQLVAAMNPCPCGWHGHPGGGCLCGDDVMRRYRGRVSGPLLDRIDMTVMVPAVAAAALAAPAPNTGESQSRTVRMRVAQVRSQQLARQGCVNAALDAPAVARLEVAPGGRRVLAAAMTHAAFTARAYHRVLKVARTIADLAGSRRVEKEHVAEALAFRVGDAMARGASAASGAAP
jgi:magnesium chelatase family protein